MSLNELELLRTYEPILRFTHGELFHPCPVDGYVANCSLWKREPNGETHQLESLGDLDLQRLAGHGPAEPDATLFLQFVSRPLEGLAFSRWLLREDRPVFRAPGRLARVGIGVRALDSLFELALLLRGTVPGGTVAAAEQQYRRIMAGHTDGHPYYGRVVRQGNYIVLQYLFFYAMNDWRTTFHGMNDHEADWEQIFVFLEDSDEQCPHPVWVAYASHDFSGDDLRRRWDDPELEIEGTHPVVYVAAGSHASYFQQGEYLTRYEVAFLKPVTNAIRSIRRVWTGTLRQGNPSDFGERIAGLLSFPFIDYARGDGMAVGPNQSTTWTPVVLTSDTDWAHGYRGLWGLDTTDPFDGETAPAGPKFNRNGTVRQSWNNPLGWAGLHKVAPPRAAREMIQERIHRLQSELGDVEDRLAILSDELPQLGLEVGALKQSDHLSKLRRERQAELERAEAELNELYARRNELTEILEASEQYQDRLSAGEYEDPGAHVVHRFEPQTTKEIRAGRLAEGWAAFSVGILLLGFVGVAFVHPGGWVTALVVVVGAFLMIDAALRRHLEDLILAVTIVLGIVSFGVLIFEFFWQIILVVVVALSALIIVDNFREIRRR